MPLIRTEITILGGNWTIEGAGGAADFRLFETTPARNLTLSHLGVENGRITIVPGQIYGGGAILATARLRDATFSGNAANGQVAGNGAANEEKRAC